MRALLSVVLVLTMVACDGGGDGGGNGDGNGGNGGSDGGGDGGGVDTGPGSDTAAQEDTTGPVGCSLPDLTGRAYRITLLESQEPTDALNPTFAMDIATYVNVLVFYIVEHNADEGYIMMHAGPCSTEFVDPDAQDLVPAAFHYGLPTDPFRVDLDGCDFEIKEAAVLEMMFKTLNKPYVIDRLFGTGTIREDLSGIDDGHLEGGILVETAIGLCTTIPGMGVVNFHWFMNLAHICPNFDTDGDDVDDAYYFAGTFDATDVTDLFVPDEIVPIESVVEECEPHDEECIP